MILILVVIVVLAAAAFILKNKKTTLSESSTDLGWSECPSRSSFSQRRVRAAVRAESLFSGTPPKLRTEPLACSRSTSRACRSRRDWTLQWSARQTGDRRATGAIWLVERALLLLCSPHMTISRARPRVTEWLFLWARSAERAHSVQGFTFYRNSILLVLRDVAR